MLAAPRPAAAASISDAFVQRFFQTQQKLLKWLQSYAAFNILAGGEGRVSSEVNGICLQNPDEVPKEGDSAPSLVFHEAHGTREPLSKRGFLHTFYPSMSLKLELQTMPRSRGR